MNADDIARRLRYRVTGLLHVGRAEAGSRLPSIRSTADALGADHRAVAAAYKQLEEEGLVEIRPGSGVYVASRARLTPGVASSAAAWIAGVFLEGWERRVPRSRVGDLVERCARLRVRCVCADAVEDHRVAVAAALEEDFGLDVDPVPLGPGGVADAGLLEHLEAADMAVTLRFDAPRVQRLAARAGTPLVVASINPELARAVEAVFQRGPVVAVVSDPAMAERAEGHLGVTDHRDTLRVVLADAVASLDGVAGEGESVLATRAARRRLGVEDYHLLPAPPTFLAPASARAILDLVAHMALRDLEDEED